MALEPVNERPIIPQLYRPDAQGVSGWSISLVRQLTTVFQQYGYRINKGLTVEDLGSEGGTLLEEARLVSEGGNIPELDQLANFAQMLQVGGADLIQTDSNANGTWVVLLGAVQVCFFTETTGANRSGTPFQSAMTFPAAFGSMPLVLASRQYLDNSTTGFDTATSEPHALNVTTTDFNWTIHETGSTFLMGYIAMGVPS